MIDSFSQQDLRKLNAIAADLVKENVPFERMELSLDVALEMFKYNQ